MPYHEPFDFQTKDELLAAADKLNLDLPFQGDIAPLLEPITIGTQTLPNRLAVHPMEGADAYPHGAPSDLTMRRYLRYARGGSGMIWFEATAVTENGRANPRQLMLTSTTLDTFKRMLEKIRAAGREIFGDSHYIYCVLQLTHSGRYSWSKASPAPLIVARNPYLDKNDGSTSLWSDEDLDYQQDHFLEAAGLAYHAGFDAIDIKCCHGYLLNEILAAYTREHSRYGQSFENRTRFVTEVVYKIRAQHELPLTSRLSGFDGLPYPHGFGFSKDNIFEIDLTELRALMRRLLLLGCTFFNVSAGNPYYNPHVVRPYDCPVSGSQLPDEHPLEGVKRLLNIAAGLQKSFPNVPLVGSGYSWLRQFFPYVGAAVVARGEASMIGLGRSSFAYPDAPQDLMEQGELDPKKVCISCSKCSELMRRSSNCGCVVRDAEVYRKEYRKIIPV